MGSNTIAIVAACDLNLKHPHEEAIRRTQAKLPHEADWVLACNYKPLDERIRWVDVPNLEHARDYYVEASVLHWHRWFADYDIIIAVQHDGYAINRYAWTDEFLEYDYIGSPWPWHLLDKSIEHKPENMKYRVGNSGFTLRSRKFLEVSSRLGAKFLGQWEKDDVFWSQTHRKHFEDEGINFAPFELAGKWGTEWHLEEFPEQIYGSWGFHGPMEERKHLIILPNR